MSEIYYSYENDREHWNSTDIHDEVVGYADEYGVKVGQIIEIFEGQGDAKRASDYLGDVFDTLADNAWDDAGELSDAWPSVNHIELHEHMKQAVDEFFDQKKDQPSFVTFSSIKQIDIRITKVDEDGHCEDWEFVDATENVTPAPQG